MTEPRPWPDDTSDLIFLQRFVEEIGRRAFPDWTGTEATVEQQVVLLPELAWANSHQRRHATLLLFKHRPDLTARPNPHLGADELFKQRPYLWSIAQRLALPKEAARALHRLRSVRNEIILQSRARELMLKIRRVRGGLWKDWQSVWWNVDRPEDYFRSCIINPEDPFGGRPSRVGNNDHWIFAPREGIDQIAARLAVSRSVIPSPEKESSASAIGTEVPAAAVGAEPLPVLPAAGSGTAQPPPAPDETAATPTPGAEAGPPATRPAEPAVADPEPDTSEVVMAENRGGRKPIVSKDRVANEVFRLMNEKGEFCADDPEWDAQARLEDEIGVFCEHLTGKRPKETTLKDYIKEPLQQWRRGSKT
jgi:hypothetical protein